MKLTQKRLKELLDYDPETGIFVWRVARGDSVSAGDIAGSLHKTSGNWQITIEHKSYLAHRLVFLYTDGYLPPAHHWVTHKSGDKLNNRRLDLHHTRPFCVSRQNGTVRKDNKSGVTGVSWHTASNRWTVKIKIPKNIYLGSFVALMDAVRARWDAEVKYGFTNSNTTSPAYVYLRDNGLVQTEVV